MPPDARSFHLDDDDRPIGEILSRRDVLRVLAAGSAAMMVGCKPGARTASAGASTASAGAVASNAIGALPACVAKPELTVGPYFVDAKLHRSDIRIEPSTNAAKPGAPLELGFRVQQIVNGQCAPLAGAMVDVWQCDASGQYSGVNDRMVGFDTSGQTFLRGYQVTDASGIAIFTTIYPGWYQGRAVHIHFKIRTTDGGRTGDFTSQLFFDESVNDAVLSQPPYTSRPASSRVRNTSDGIFRGADGKLTLVTTQSAGGYSATFDIGLT